MAGSNWVIDSATQGISIQILSTTSLIKIKMEVFPLYLSVYACDKEIYKSQDNKSYIKMK